jgi:hypothetical protein
MLPARRRALVSAWSRRLLVLVAACVVAYLARRFFLRTPRTMSGLGQFGIRHWEVVRTSFARGDGMPLWDRTECGGRPFAPNPETQLVSGLLAAAFDVGGDVMSRWYPTLGVVVAVTGVYAWGRRVFALRAIPALFAGAIFGASGFVCGQFAAQTSFVPFALVPWILLLARLGEDDLRAAVGAGALLGLAALEGGAFVVPYTLVALALVEGARLASPGRAYRVLRLGSLVIVTFALVAGAKLYPQLVELVRHPAHPAEVDKQTWAELIPMFIDNRQGGFPGHPYGYDEYRAYVGPLALGFAIAGAGAALILKPRRLEGVLLLVAGLLLARGRYEASAPYALLQKLPVFAQLHVPSRFIVLALLGMAIAAGIALDASMNVVAKRRPIVQALLVAIAVVAIYDPLVTCENCHKLWLTEPTLPPMAVSATPFHFVDGRDAHRSAEYPSRDVGVTGCIWKSWDYPEARDLPIGEVPQAHLDPGAGRVTKVEVTQNAYLVELEAPRPTVLHVHSTYDPDWSSDLGKPRRALNGQLELPIPAGKQTVRLRYRPLAFFFGVGATAFGLVFVGAVMWLGRTRRAKAAKVVAAVAPPGATPAAA